VPTFTGAEADACFLFDQLGSVAGQVALGARQNEAALQKPMLQQLRNPLAVAKVILASRHLL
jgi:hypothetical protein